MDLSHIYRLNTTELLCKYPLQRTPAGSPLQGTITPSPSRSPYTPLHSHFDSEALPALCSSLPQHQASAQLKQANIFLARGNSVAADPVYAIPSSTAEVQYALQKIEASLMASDEGSTPTSSAAEESKPSHLSLQQPRAWGHQLRHHSPSTSGKYPLASFGRPEKRLKEDTQSIVRRLLVQCAEALSEDDVRKFHILETEARKVVSVSGEPIQRLGAYLLEGLVARTQKSGNNIYRAESLKCSQPNSKELVSYMRILYDYCPHFKFGYMAANGAIADALKNEDSIHIIDFQIGQGTQWITLMQALASRPGGPPRVRITGIHNSGTDGDGLEQVEKLFADLSENFKIPVKFEGLRLQGPWVTRELLNIKPGEALAVNFTFQLHHTPDESVDVMNPRDNLLRLVKGLSPKVTTLVEQESNTNTTPFLTRFIETLDYYSAMFESIDANLPRDNKDRINVEQHCLAKDIVNIVACEGAERVERHELLGKWRSRLMMAGFEPYPLNAYVNSVIRKLLVFYSDKYTVIERDGAMLLGWNNRSLISASAWH